MSEQIQKETNEEIQAKIDAFAKGEIEYDALSPEIQDILGASTNQVEPKSVEDSGKVDDNVDANEQKDDSPDLNAVLKQLEDLKNENKILTDKHKDLQKKHYDKSVEANNAEQKILSKLKKDEEYRNKILADAGLNRPKLPKLNVNDPNFEHFDDENIKIMYQKVESLEEQNERLQRELDNMQSTQNKVNKIEDTFSEINSLMDMHSELRTQIPFRKIDEAVKSAYMKNGGRNVTKDDLLLEGIAKEDAEKAFIIYELDSRREKGLYNTIKSAYRDSEIFEDYLNASKNNQLNNINEAFKKQAFALDETKNRISKEPTTILNVSSVDNMDKKSDLNKEIQQFLIDNPDLTQLSPEKQKIWNKYEALI